MITGVGTVAPHPQEGGPSADNRELPAPEITGFEVPEGAPTWGYEVLDVNLETELPNVKSYIDRTSALALVAGKKALTDAGLIEREKRPVGLDIGCAFGTMMGCLEAMGIFWNKVKTTNPKFAQPLIFTHGYANSPSSLLCIEHQLRGPAATFSGERLAGMEALMFAYDQIATGAGEAMLVCASESLTQAVWNHFYSKGVLSTTGVWGSGMIPGEGSVALLLESETSATQRKQPILAELADLSCVPDDGSGGAFCHLRTKGAARSSETEANVDWITGDLLSVEPFYFLAQELACMDGRSSISPQDLDVWMWPFQFESRPVGNNRIQAHIKKW